MISLMITDLDNTLLRSDKTISDYTVDVLKRCQQAGCKIAYATARSKQAAAVFIEWFTPDFFIGYGGAYVSARGETLHRFTIPPKTARAIIDTCLNTPEITAIHAINETVALSSYPEQDMRHYRLTDFTREQDHHYLKISFTTSNPDTAKRIAAYFPMCHMTGYSGEDLHTLTNRDAVKWNAIKIITERYAYDTGTLVAFGDDYNDVEMVQQCGTGVAVKNAIPEVQSAATFICDTNDNDGVAKWMEAHIPCICHSALK